MKDFWHTKDAVNQIFTDECILYLIKKDLRYIEPTISRDYTLCWRVLYDRRHRIEGGLTEVFGIYDRIDDVLLRHIKIKRGVCGYFNEDKDITITDIYLDKQFLKELKEEFIQVNINPIGEGSDHWTCVDYTEVEWKFERTRIEVGWSYQNKNMESLDTRINQIIEQLKSKLKI